MATVSSEKPGASAGGDKGGRRKRQYGKAECWNCGGKGHRRNDCPNKKDDKDKDSSGKNEQRKEGNNSSGGSSSSSSKNKNSSLSGSKDSKSSGKQASTGAAAVEEVSGAWAVIEDDLYDYDGICEINEPTLSDDAHDLYDYGAISEIDENRPVNDVSGLTACVMDDDRVHIPEKVHVFTTSVSNGGDCIWDLYDSGASHHMSPCREEFLNFKEIAPKALT
ncbi:hypothetical protein APHAL10511_000242, partial [Amanita phalloides]